MSGTYISEVQTKDLARELIGRLETELLANGPDADVEELLIKLRHYLEGEEALEQV